MKRIVAILASPRINGNSSALMESFCLGASTHDVSIQRYVLADLAFSGCRNLMSCKNALESCGQNDALTPLLADIITADIVAIATPVYFTDVPGQLKSCMDRWFSFFKPDYANRPDKSRLPSGKTIVWLQTQGESADNYDDILTRYNHSFEWLGFTHSHLVQAANVREPGEIFSSPSLIEQASALGEKLGA